MSTSCLLVTLMFYIYILAFVIQLIIWVLVFSKLLITKDNKEKHPLSSVTIIICTKNRVGNLKANLNSILSQDYNPLITFLVDDFSDDETEEYIRFLQQKERYLKLYKVKLNNDGKKQALSEAIVKVKTDWALLTDDDCCPNSSNWVKAMISEANRSQSSIVLGYSPYSSDGSFLGKWIHHEAWITGIQYLSYAVSGMPYMGVGRNILYSMDILKPSHITNHADLKAGDDDLTVNMLAIKDNTSICLSPDSFVWSSPSESWKDYIKQKKRHYSVSNRYKFKHKVAISAYTMSHIAFYIAIPGLLLSPYWKMSIVLYIFRLIIIFPIVNKLMRKMESLNSVMIFPIMDILQAFYYLFFSFAVINPKKSRW